MPNWKKVITSGSNAELNELSSSGLRVESNAFVGGNLRTNTITSTGNVSFTGPTIFGDNSTNISNMNNISALGNISSSLASTGSFGRVESTTLGVTTFNPDSISTTHITSSNGVSASGKSTFDNITLDGSTIKSNGTTFTISSSGDLNFNAHGKDIRFGPGDGFSDFVFNLEDNPELDVTGNFTIDCSGDITLDAAGDDIIFRDQSDNRFIFNLEDAPELDVTGDFTIDGDGLIKLDSATNIVNLVGNVTASGDISASGDFINSQTIQMTAAASTLINTFNTSSFQTCKYLLQVTSASVIQSSELLVMQNGSNAFNTEYAQMNSGVNLVNFTTDVNNSNVRLLGDSSFISCSVTFNRTLI